MSGEGGSKAARRVRGIVFDLDETLVYTGRADAVAYDAVRGAKAGELDAAGLDRLVAGFRQLLKATPWDASGRLNTHEWRSTLWQRSWDAAREGEALPLEREAAAGGAADPATLGGGVGAQLYDLWFRTRIDNFRMPAEHEELLERLRGLEFELLCITNGDQLTQRAKLEACGAERHFPVILVGHEEDAPKPAPGIFHKAIAAAGLEPADCVMIGDSLRCDIGGAKAAGLRAAVWVTQADDVAAAAAAANPTPDFAVRSVMELPGVIEKLHREAEVVQA